MILALVLAATAAEPAEDASRPDWVIETLQRELARNKDGLRLEQAPSIYHLRYHVLKMSQVDAFASFGSLVSVSEEPFSSLAVELRVGGPVFDNTGFGGWQNGFGVSWLPEQTTPEALQLEAWRLTDRSYKQAVEQFARKTAQFQPPPDYPGDYLLTGPTVALTEVATAPQAELAEIAAEVSAAFVGPYALERGDVLVGQEAGAHWIVDTEGTLVRRSVEECTIRAVAHVRSEDGLLLTDHRLWTVRRADQLPPVDAMQREVRAMAAQLEEIASAATLEEEYVGPVVFEDQAAIDLFRYLLIPQLEGTPAEVPFESWLGDLGSIEQDSVRLGRRVLPSGWTVTDDPMRYPDHPGSFRYDVEGTKAQPVELVQNGIVRTLLMSRVPRADLVGTNGHGRGNLGERAAGRATSTEIVPAAHLSERQIRKKALKLAAEYGRDWILVVRRLQEPAVRSFESGMLGDEESTLPPPIVAVRVWADGREELVRGVAFAGVHRFVLRDVVGAGEQVEGNFMAAGVPGGEPSYLGPTEGMPTLISAPEVLIGEMELVPTPGDPRNLPVIPPPTLADLERAH